MLMASVSPGIEDLSPGRQRRWRMMMSWVFDMMIPYPLMQMPSPGALCPAMVRKGCLIEIGLNSSMVPETWKTTVRGSFASAAARRLPGPLS